MWVDLAHRAVGSPLVEVLQIRYIHRDMRDYPTVMVQLQVRGGVSGVH